MITTDKMSLILFHRLIKLNHSKDDVLLILLFTFLCLFKTSLSTTSRTTTENTDATSNIEITTSTTSSSSSSSTSTSTSISSSSSSSGVTFAAPTDISLSTQKVDHGASGEYPIYDNFKHFYKNDELQLSSIHRILRNSDNLFRNDNVRWRKTYSADMERKLFKRNVVSSPATIHQTTLAATHTTTDQSRSSSSSSINSSSSSSSSRISSNVNINRTKINSTKLMRDWSQRMLNDKTNFSELLDLNEQHNFNGDILVLNLSKNQFKYANNLNVSYFKLLESLDMSENMLLTFNSSMSKLIFLNLSNNRLQQFAISKQLRNLRILDLSSNNLTTTENTLFNDVATESMGRVVVDFSYLSDLEVLDLSCNQFAQLHRTVFQNTTNLKHVNLSNNRLVKILKKYFFNLMNIETLVLSHNNISDIENDTFAYLPNLQYLDLSFNDIDAMSIRALQGIPDLIGLSVAFNPRLGNALQGFVASWSLKELDVSGTGLCQIPAALAQSVHTLNVSHNHFQVS